MSVGIEGESCGEVTQHTGYCFDVHAVLQSQCCEGVAEVMEPDFREPCPLQHSVQHIQHTVWGDGASVRRWEDILDFSAYLLSLLFQNFDRIISDGHGTVGVFCFQRCFYDLSVDSGYLSLHSDGAVVHVDVIPFESQQLTSAEAGCQFDVVHLVHAGFSGFSQEGSQLLYGESFHLSVFYFRQSAGFCRIGVDQLLLLCQI